MIRAFIAAAVALSSSAASSQTVALCQDISGLMDSQAIMVHPLAGYLVGGKERLHFHSAPFPSCSTETFVVPGDHLTARLRFDTWIFVTYIHPITGESSEGWVKDIQLSYSGTMGSSG